MARLLLLEYCITLEGRGEGGYPRRHPDDLIHVTPLRHGNAKKRGDAEFRILAVNFSTVEVGCSIRRNLI